MTKGIFEEFDGYGEIAQSIEMSRRYGVDYTPGKDMAWQFIDRLHPARIEFRVSDVIDETPSTKTFRLVADQGVLPPFQAGQYIALFLEIGGIRTSRPYSISSPPNQTGHYDLTVARVPGGLVSNHLLDKITPGDKLTGSGPAGHFYHNPLFHDREMVCLAGGSGITPFMSMIREVVECGLDRTIHLIYGNRSLQDAIFHQKLIRMSQRFPQLNYHPVYEQPPDGWNGPTGYMTCGLIQDLIGSVDGKTFYMCGPQGMYDFCLGELEQLGVPNRKIRREVYGAPIDITRAPGWPEDIAADAEFEIKVGSNSSFKAKAGVTLLTGLEKAGYAPESQCRSGECSLCRVRVLQGKVFQPAGALVRKSDRWNGYVHACVSYPLADLEIEI